MRGPTAGVLGRVRGRVAGAARKDAVASPVVPFGLGCFNGGMRFVITVVLNALALWLTTLILPGLHVTAYASDQPQIALILTYLLLALIWGVVNSIIGSVVRIVSLPLYCLTLGLFALIVNGFLFWLVGWVSGLLGFGLTVDNFWWAIGGALLMGIFSAILNGLLNRERRDAPRPRRDRD